MTDASSSSATSEAPLFEVRDLRKRFAVRSGLTRRIKAHVHAVDGVSFALGHGQTLGLVGESGCGKTSTARLILQLDQADGGEVLLNGRNMLGASGAELHAYRRQVQMVFQDPFLSLNPRHTIGNIIAEPLRIFGLHAGRGLRERVMELLDAVSLPASALERLPHEFSGGQRQRIGIARALALNPKVIVCDEPVSALDVSIRSQIINLLVDLQNRFGISYIFIAHDLAVVEYVSDTIAVMYLGKVVEIASKESFFDAPLHPYSEALLSAVPSPSPGSRRARVILRGEVPSPIDPPTGCRFRTRCPLAESRCAEIEPPLRAVKPGHSVACHARS